MAKNFYNDYIKSLKEKISQFREDMNKKNTKSNKVHV